MKSHILFVDDEPNVLKGLQRILRAERDRWEMSFAGGADEALELMTTVEFDAVVSDVNMPGKDGFWLLAQTRSDERTRDVPVIILTGRDDSGIKRQALDLGATDLLNKPVEAQDLIARIRSAIRLKSFQDELKNQNAVLERKVAQRTADLADSRLDIIWRLGKAGEYRDEATGNHVVRVGCYSRALAEAMGMGADFVERVFLASPLHDIGKIGIPDRILLKRGPLTDQEWGVMRQHCVMGAEILRQDPESTNVFQRWHRQPAGDTPRHSDNPFLQMAATIAETHHERWDGSGYPHGLSGEAIPLESRITAWSDVYDALGSERPYKPAYGDAEVLEILRGEVGRHFDPQVHVAFERSIDEFHSIRAELADEPCVPVGAGDVR